VTSVAQTASPFTILKTNINYDKHSMSWKTVTQKQMYTAHNENLESRFLSVLLGKRLAAINVDGPMVKAKANYITAHLKNENFQCFTRH
jgi:hypothetical protein